MLKATIDIFSGRPDPQLSLSGPEARTILRDLALNRQAVGHTPPPHNPLGYYATHIEITDPNARREFGLPEAFSIACHTAPDHGKGMEVLERLLHHAPPNFGYGHHVHKHHPAVMGPTGGSDLRPMIKRLAAHRPFPLHALHLQGPALPPPFQSVGAAAVKPAPSPSAKFTSCPCEWPAYDPAFWNNAAYIRRNNCYAYATNHRTNTFPQPGRASGRTATTMSASVVSAAAKADGAHDAGNCFDGRFAPRLLVALVIWPGVDYHWYRFHGSFWGHKPGGTAARNVDNASRLILDPRTANRGGYSVFAGFMLIPKTQRVS